MCLLVVNTFSVSAAARDLHRVSERIRDLLLSARQVSAPIAHLHQKPLRNGLGLRVPIGRYEPVFRAEEVGARVPDGLIDYIVSSPTPLIKLVGAASQDQFDRLSLTLADAGYSPDLDQTAIVTAR